MKINENVRDVVKFVGSGSIQMVLGGIVAAVVPKNVSIVYKTVSYIGTTIAAVFIGDQMNSFIDEKIDAVEEILNQTSDIIAQSKTEIEYVSKKMKELKGEG